MSLSRTQYTSLLAQLDLNIEQAELQLERLKNQRRVSQFFSELQEVESGELLVLGQQDPVFALIDSSPTFFTVAEAGEVDLQVTRRDGTLSINPSSSQRSFLQVAELAQLVGSATWQPASDGSGETCTVKVRARRVGRVWTYVSESPIISVVDVAESGPQVTVLPLPVVGHQ